MLAVRCTCTLQAVAKAATLTMQPRPVLRPVLMAAKTNSMNEVEFPLSVLLLHVSARFARLFRCELDGESYGEKRPGILANWSVDVCSVSRFGRFVLFCEKDSLFVISSG